MERINNSAFSKFEGTQISNLQAIKGGQATGGGSKGNFSEGYVCWDSDTLTGNTLKIGTTYYLTQEQWVERKAGHLA